MIINRENLYEVIKKECSGKYSIGLHGISKAKVSDIYRMDEDAAASNILDNGLKVRANRSINGTVKPFGRLDDKNDIEEVYEGLTYYQYYDSDTFVIVAIPVELKSEDGRTLYIGSTNLNSRYQKHFDTTGSEVSCVCDSIILNNQNVIDPCFILGSFKVLENGLVDLKINDKHISRNGNVISNDVFDQYCSKLGSDFFSWGVLDLFDAYLRKDLSKISELEKKVRPFSMESYYLLETISQLKNEENVDDFTLEQIERTLLLLKKEYYEIQKANNEYYGSPETEKSNVKVNYTFDEIVNFALNDPYHFYELPNEIRDNVELMRSVLKTKGLNSYILNFLGDNVRNDWESMINLVNNCHENYFEYSIDYCYSDDESNFNFSEEIGIDILLNPLFWETLNKRIVEINENSRYKIPLFNVELELEFARQGKLSKNK